MCQKSNGTYYVVKADFDHGRRVDPKYRQTIGLTSEEFDDISSLYGLMPISFGCSGAYWTLWPHTAQRLMEQKGWV